MQFYLSNIGGVFLYVFVMYMYDSDVSHDCQHTVGRMLFSSDCCVCRNQV